MRLKEKTGIGRQSVEKTSSSGEDNPRGKISLGSPA